MEQQEKVLQKYDEVKKYKTKKEFCDEVHISMAKLESWAKKRASRDAEPPKNAKRRRVRSKGSGVRALDKLKISPKMHRQLEALVWASRGPPQSSHIWQQPEHKAKYWEDMTEEEKAEADSWEHVPEGESLYDFRNSDKGHRLCLTMDDLRSAF